MFLPRPTAGKRTNAPLFSINAIGGTMNRVAAVHWNSLVSQVDSKEARELLEATGRLLEMPSSCNVVSLVETAAKLHETVFGGAAFAKAVAASTKLLWTLECEATDEAGGYDED
jgi:hypothetical protein